MTPANLVLLWLCYPIIKALHELRLPYATAIAEVMVVDGKVAIYGALPGACIANSGVKVTLMRQWYEVPSAALALIGMEKLANEDFATMFQSHNLPYFGDPMSEHDKWPDELRAVTEIGRSDRDSTVTRAFSVRQAKNAGLWGKRGRSGKPTQWLIDPANMLLVRSERRCQKAAVPEAFHGVTMSEEFEDVVTDADAGGEPIAAARPLTEKEESEF